MFTKDAIECFLRTDMDMICLENWVISDEYNDSGFDILEAIQQLKVSKRK